MTTNARNINGKLTFFDRATGLWTQRHSTYRYTDNFDTYTSIPTTAANGNPWESHIVGAAPPTVAFASVNGVGKVLACTHTADDQEQLAQAHWNDQLVISLDRSPVVQYWARCAVLPTLLVDAHLGVGSAANADGLGVATYNAAFVIDAAGAVSAVVDDNATPITASTGITMTLNQWYVFRMEFFDLTNVRFAINGNYVATSTAFDISAVTTGANRLTQPTISTYKASGAGVGTIQVRRFDAWQD